MKLKFFFAITIVISLNSLSFAQADIASFWASFKSSVINGDKTSVAKMTRFPLSVPYGVKQVKSKADFIKRYDAIMNFEADVKRCFATQSIEKDENPKRYFVNCTFKSEPESSDNRPIFYYFEKTKTHWKFVGLDNINE
jgi:hypothetical protein